MAYGSGSGSGSGGMSPPKSESKPKMSAGKMTDKQKADLKKHMASHKDMKDMSPSQLKSHRMKMMSRMRRGMSISKAHKDIMK